MMRVVKRISDKPLEDVEILFERGDILEVVDIDGEWWAVMLEAEDAEELWVLPPPFKNNERRKNT